MNLAFSSLLNVKKKKKTTSIPYPYGLYCINACLAPVMGCSSIKLKTDMFYIKKTTLRLPLQLYTEMLGVRIERVIIKNVSLKLPSG